jgi:hypothetical protein
MKTEQHHEAEQLFLQHNLSKTEIAEKLNINRRTVTLWAQQGNWDKIRKSSQHMPSILAEKCYHLLDHYLSYLMTEGATFSTFTLKHAQTIHLLTTSIKKLKNRSTTNETMEMFNFFLPGLKRRDPKLAADLVPYVEEFINTRAAADPADFVPDGFNENGYTPFPEKDIQETHQDERDSQSLADAFEEFVRTQPNEQPTATQPPNEPQHPAAQTPNAPNPYEHPIPNSQSPIPNQYPQIPNPQFPIPPFASSLPALNSTPTYLPFSFTPTCSSPAPRIHLLSTLTFHHDPIPNYQSPIPHKNAA